MVKSVTKSYKVYRDAKTGKFVPAKVAARRPASTKCERVSVKPKASKQSISSIKSARKKYRKALTGLAQR